MFIIDADWHLFLYRESIGYPPLSVIRIFTVRVILDDRFIDLVLPVLSSRQEFLEYNIWVNSYTPPPRTLFALPKPLSRSVLNAVPSPLPRQRLAILPHTSFNFRQS